MSKRRRTEITRIADPAARLVTYSKRRKGLFNKASELCRLCGARAAVVVFSPAGKLCTFGDPSADDVISDYLGHRDGDGDVMSRMGLTEWADWMETEWDACTTEEDLHSLILKYEAVRDCAREKLKSLEDESQVKIGAGDSHVLEGLGQCAALSDLLTDGDLNGYFTSPENSAAGGESSAAESTPALFDHEGCGDHEFDPDGFLNLLEGDRHGFFTSPEDSAIGPGYNPNDFVGLEDLDVLL